MSIQLWGQQQRVNVTTAGSQRDPALTVLANGNIVVVWTDPANSGDVLARIYNPGGSPVSGELVLASGAAIQERAAITALGNGGFRVAFEEGPSVFWREFTATGAVVSGTGTGPLESPAIAGSGTGQGYIVAPVFSTDAVFYLFNDAAALVLQGGVSTTNTGNQNNIDVVKLSTAQYAIVWNSQGTEIRGRVINAADGSFTTGADFLIGATSATGAEPRVTALQGGAFLVAWFANGTGYPSDQTDIRARVMNANGTAGTAEFLLVRRVAQQQTLPDVVSMPDGGFVAVWVDNNGEDHVRAQRFDPYGNPIGADVRISTVGDVFRPSDRGISAALMPDGRIAVTWIVESVSGDADHSIHLQIIDPRDGFVEGGDAADVLYGGAFADTIIGYLGNDTVFAGGSDDVVYGGVGNDLLNAGTGADVVYADAGTDTVFAELGDDLIYAGEGGDTVNGGAGDDAVYGQDGDDVVFGDAGADAFFGGFGNDTGFVGAGNDVAFGEEGGDTLIGDDGDDVLDGGAGGDVLNGGAGVDNLIGGGEGDILIGGPGGDRLEGGAGGDLYWWQAQTELNDLVVGFNSAEDQLQFTGSQFGGFTAGSNLLNGTTFISSANPNPTGAVPTFLYNNVDGSLFFDPDGTGGAARVFVALFQGAPALTGGDFQFV